MKTRKSAASCTRFQNLFAGQKAARLAGGIPVAVIGCLPAWCSSTSRWGDSSSESPIANVVVGSGVAPGSRLGQAAVGTAQSNQCRSRKPETAKSRNEQNPRNAFCSAHVPDRRVSSGVGPRSQLPAQPGMMFVAFRKIMKSTSLGLWGVPAWLVTPVMVIFPPDLANGFELATINVTVFVAGLYDGVALTGIELGDRLLLAFLFDFERLDGSR